MGSIGRTAKITRPLKVRLTCTTSAVIDRLKGRFGDVYVGRRLLATAILLAY